MKLDIQKIKQYIERIFQKLPLYFEKYELFIIFSGAVAAFLLGGFIFYIKALKAVDVIPEVEISVLKVRSDLFDKTIEELGQRKEAAPDLPIIDPFK